MIAAALSRERKLAAQGTAFVTATVVRAQRPTSVKAGDVALVLGDGTIEGFVGGVCAQQSVRVYALKAIETEEALLLRIVPGRADRRGSRHGSARSRSRREPSRPRTRASPAARSRSSSSRCCPAPRVLVVGDTPIAAALVSLGAELGLDLVAVRRGRSRAVAARSRARRRRARTGRAAHAAPRVSRRACRTSASSRVRKRGAGVLAELRADGVPEEQLALIDVPAGIDIGARTPAEIALSILAQIVAVRRGKRVATCRRRVTSAYDERAAAPTRRRSRRPDLRDDRRRGPGHAVAARSTARPSTSAARAARRRSRRNASMRSRRE